MHKHRKKDAFRIPIRQTARQQTNGSLWQFCSPHSKNLYIFPKSRFKIFMVMETESNPKSFQKREFLSISKEQDHNLEGAMPNNICDKFLDQIFSTEFKRIVRSTQSASCSLGVLLGLGKGTRQQQTPMCI